MQATIFLTVSALIYTVVTAIIFFLKDKINKVENRIYKRLLTATILSMFMELFIVFTVNIRVIGTIIQKLFLTCIILWLAIFMTYTFVVTLFNKKDTEENNIKKYKNLHYVFIIFNVLICFLILVLPMKFNSIGNSKFTSGPAVNVVFITLGIYAFTMAILVFTHFNSVHKKGYIPIIVLIILLMFEGIIQKIHPEILLSNSVFGFIVYLMYFTIENPDVKIIEQLTINKKLIERSNEDKSNFLFKVSQEVRKPIEDIIRVSNITMNESDIDKKNNGLKYIEMNAKNLKSIVNDVLDVSKMDTYNIKMIPTTYSIYNVFKEIISKYNNINSNLEFRYNISKSIPEYLYGDAVKVKQVITTILENAFNYTKEGFVDLQIDSIVKNDVCRLIITIEDSGIGMSLDKVNELLSIDMDLKDTDIKKLEGMNLSLNIATKIVRLLGGQLIIKSEEGVGSEFISTIEQKIPRNCSSLLKEKTLIEYSNSLFGKNRVLLVSDKKEINNQISEILKKYDVDVFSSTYGQDCIDRIKEGITYDLIIIDDEMQPMSGINTLQELKKIHKFKIPVVIVLSKIKESIKEHYINDGFNDYILLNNLNIDLDRIVKKYF